MLARRYRLHKNFQFSYVYKKGTSVSARNLALVFVKAGGGARVGFSVSNKIGKAVVRNKVRRRLRESVRRLLPRMPKGFHYVFIARPGITAEVFDDIFNSIVYLLKKARLYDDPLLSGQAPSLNPPAKQADRKKPPVNADPVNEDKSL